MADKVVVIHTFPSQENANIQYLQAKAYIEELVQAHHRGEHPYGSMRRDCPLCAKQ